VWNRLAVADPVADEKMCFWLIEVVKSGGEQRIRESLSEETADQIVQVAPVIRTLVFRHVR
jgi:hypothetical protein